MAEFLLLVVKPASQPLPKTPVSESSGYSYATGGYFVGVLPVRYGVDNKINLRFAQVLNCEMRNIET
ncbi:hypothetical protein AAF285_003339 [Salmonella enterica]|nr:hypothetical protein [Salmonella enterica]